MHPPAPAQGKMNLHQPDRLLGRSAEESILLNSYFASLSKGQDKPASVILIHGDSGLGKTKLAEFLRPHVLGDDGYFIRGKFDQLSYGSANRPYSGISSAFAEYCSAVEQRGDDTRTEVVTKLQREIKAEEGRLLLEAIPSLRKIISGAECKEHGAECQQQGGCTFNQHVVHRRYSCEMDQRGEEEKRSCDIFSESGSHHFIYLIKRVVSVISSVGDPIVFLIDDIQWANKTEIDVLKALMTGAHNPFTFIFTCRPGNHPFLNVTNEFGGRTEIVLHSLNWNAVRELVGEILQIEDVDNCTSLTNFVYRVTNGNPFFVRQQIISLRDEGLLRWGDSGWVWKIKEIEEAYVEASGADNVLLMLLEKMKKLPPLTQEVLKICACIGSSVDLYLLGLLIRHTRFMESSDREENKAVARMAVAVASREGLLSITESGDGVAFAHDSVNEAAYSLVEYQEQESYHLRLGKTLLKHVPEGMLGKYVYAIASQLARGIELIDEGEDRLDIASIFLSAGERSSSAAAFPEAHFFLTKSVFLLRESDWTDHYRLCSDVYMKCADTAALSGNDRDQDKCLAVLFERCRGSVVDSLNATYIQVRSLQAKDSPDALDVGLEALKTAGQSFPSKNLTLHTMVELSRTRSAMKRKGADKLHQLEPISDAQIVATLRLLYMLVTLSIAWNQKLMPLICFRVIQLNLKHGYSKAMPNAVAMYGALLGRIGYPLSEAAKYGEIAIALQNKMEDNEHAAHLWHLTYGVLFTQTKRLSDCVKPLRVGFDSGLKQANLTHAMSCGQVAGWVAFFSGMKLNKVAALLDSLRVSMNEYRMAPALSGNRIYINVVAYFLGSLNSSRFYQPVDTDGDIVASSGRTNKLLLEQANFIQLVAACIFGDSEIAWACAGKSQHFGEMYSGTVWPYVCAFYRGMAAAAMMHTSRSGHYAGTLKLCLKVLRRAKKRSVCNITHQLFLLEAENAALRKKHSTAENFYSRSIEEAATAGVTHEHAYACERFGTYYLLRKRHSEAYEQIREAHRLYKDWGSRPKCELLKKRYPKLEEEDRFAP